MIILAIIAGFRRKRIMSEERMRIEFAIKSKEFADVVNRYSSELMNDYDEYEEGDFDFRSFLDADYDGTVYTDNNITIGSLIASEYDDMWDGWRPQKQIPEGENVIGWFLDVICHGDYEKKLSDEGIAYIRDNAASLEKSLEKYKIIHFEDIPHEESNVHYEEYDGEHHVAYRMYPDNWRCMWDKRNKAEAQAIFEKHHINMDLYCLDDAYTYAGDVFGDLYPKAVFMELLKHYGDIKIINTGSKSGQRTNSGVKNSIFSSFEKREVNIEDVAFDKKTVCAGTLNSCYDANENEYYGDAGTPFDVAKTVIEYLGGKVTKSVSPKTDYVIISEYMNILGERSYQYDWYKDEQKRLKASVAEADKKRLQKKLPKIQMIKEESLYDWLRIKYEELKVSTDLFNPFGIIRIVLLPEDKNAYSNLEFKSELFFDIPEDQMRKAATGIDSLSNFISNVEAITKTGIFAESGIKKNNYNYVISMDEQYKLQDYRAIVFKYECSNGSNYEVRIK